MPRLAFGQTETGQISGTVLDPSGASIVGAAVSVTQTATKLERSGTSNASGVFSFSNLQPGNYSVAVNATGFGPYQSDIVVSVGTPTNVDVRLAVGGATQTVEVQDSAVQVNTETQTLSTVVDTKQVLELPSLTRNPYDFVATAGNVTDDSSMRGAGVAINGQRSASTNILLDGVSNNDEFTATVGQQVPLDSVQELSILTNNFTAEFGRASGGVVNVVTKSGTNAFHGTGYEFNRVSDLAANTFNANASGVPISPFTRNQFGYSIGGPAIKNKLFFFENTEWIRVRSVQNNFVYTPSSALIAASAPATQAYFSSIGALSPSARILQGYSRNDLIAAGDDPCAGSASGGPCQSLNPDTAIFNRVSYTAPADSGAGSPQNTYELVGRVDYNLSDKTQFYGRYALYSSNLFAGTVTNSPYSGFNTGENDFNNAFVLSVTHVFTPSVVSQTKLDFNRLNSIQGLGTQPVVPTLYFNQGFAQTLNGLDLALPGYSAFTPGNAVPFGGPQNYAILNQDINWSYGKHQIRVGGSATYFQDNRTFGAYEEAVEALGTNIGNGVDNLLSGQLSSFQAAIYPQGKFPCVAGVVTAACTLDLPVGPPNFSRSNRFKEGAAYAQDSWKVIPRLTVNYGVRWEVYGTPHNNKQDLDSNFYLGQGNDIYQQVANGSVQIAENSSVGGLWNTNWLNFAPRVGLAFDPFGDGKWSLRGGYGIGYERDFNNVTFNVIQNPPNYGVISLTAGVDVPSIPITLSNAGPLAGDSGTKAFPKVTLRAVDPHIKTAYAQFYSASLEHSLAPGAILALEYSGSYGLNQYSIDRLNIPGQGNYFLGDPCPDGPPCTTRLNQQYSYLNFRTNAGTDTYNALNTRFELRNIHHSGVSLRANYTWSHAIDDLSSTFSETANGSFNLGHLDPLNPGLDKGDSDYDARHRVVVAAVWDLPFFTSPGFSHNVLGGWTIAPIFTARTGNPFSIYDCTNAGYVTCPRAAFDSPVPGPQTNVPSPGVPNQFNYIDLSNVVINSSVVNPLAGVSDFGPFAPEMSGRNVFRAPGFWNIDLGVYKTFKITERLGLQLRGEAYNLANHSNFYVGYGSADVSSVSAIPANRGNNFERRNMQLAAKVTF